MGGSAVRPAPRKHGEIKPVCALLSRLLEMIFQEKHEVRYFPATPWTNSVFKPLCAFRDQISEVVVRELFFDGNKFFFPSSIQKSQFPRRRHEERYGREKTGAAPPAAMDGGCAARRRRRALAFFIFHWNSVDYREGS